MAWGSLLLLAGPNGAGKSTLFKALRGEASLKDYAVLNADDRTLGKLVEVGFSGFGDTPLEILKRFFIEAAEEVQSEALALLESGCDVCLESVLSTTKYCEMVEKVTAERVALRVRKGGHDVPANRLEARWRRSLELLPWFVARAHDFSVLDNSGDAPLMLATGRKGEVRWLVPSGEVFVELRDALLSAHPA